MSKTLGNVTAHAERAAKLSPAFDTAMRRVFTGYGVELSAIEDTVETEDSEPGRRRVRLVLTDGSSLVIGWVHLGARKAELNTLGHTLSLSKQQLGREIVVKPVEYLRFLEVASHVLQDHGVTNVAVVSVGKSVPPRRRLPTLPYVAVEAAEKVEKTEKAARRSYS